MNQPSKNKLSEVFSQDFNYNIFGSITFELLKLAHEYALFGLLPIAIYGMKGLIFSILYLSIALADFGFISGIAPFIHSACKNKKTFTQFLCYSLLTQIPIFAIAGFLATQFCLTKLAATPAVWLLFPLIITEGMRMFLRAVLHITFTTKPTILSELTLTIGYLVIIWGGHWIFKIPLTLSFIFIPYLLTSITALGILFFLIHKVYKSLDLAPQNAVTIFPTHQFLITRLTAYGLSTPKKFFTGNFIVPLFSSLVSFEKIALIKYASYLAESTHSLLKATIGFSGNALLSAVQKTKHQTKRIAFSLIFQKFTLLFVPIICFILFSIPLLNYAWKDYLNKQLTMTYSMLFLTLMLMDHLFLIYEQFYLMEHKAHKLLILRALELLLLYTIIHYYMQATRIYLLISLIIIRATTFATLAVHAYKKWKLFPSFALSFKQLGICVGSALFAITIIAILL